MKLSELTYVTQDIIKKGGINVTSPEMMDEARRYNMSMVTNAAKRQRANVATGMWFVLHLPLPFFWVCLMFMSQSLFEMSTTDVTMIMSYAAIAAVLLGLIAYYVLFGYYVIYRFQRDPKLVLICSLPVLLAMFPTGILVVIVNVIMAMWYTKTDEKLSQEAGYPAFARLNVTTVDSDSKSIHDLTYDSIKERSKRLRSEGEEFL